MSDVGLYSKESALIPLDVNETRLAQKEKTDDVLQTLCAPAPEIMIFPRAKRLVDPLNGQLTYTPIAERTDIGPCTGYFFDEDETLRLLGQYKTPQYSQQPLRPGWLYLFKDGKLWKEYCVADDPTNNDQNNNSQISGGESGKALEEYIQFCPNFYPVDIDTLDEDVRVESQLGTPYLLLPQEADVEMAWSEVQWGLKRIAAVESDVTLRQKRCKPVSLRGAQAGADPALMVCSDEKYQLFANTSVAQWMRELVPELFGAVGTMRPVKHAITVVFDDYLEVGRELANRYQQAVAAHDNLIMELKDPSNTGDFPSGEPLKYPYRFARWFDSALFSYQKFFEADDVASQDQSPYFSRTHPLYMYRSQLDIKDIYTALGMDSRRLARAYTEQCHWQLMNYIRGQHDAQELVEETDKVAIELLLIQLEDYQGLPALSQVIIDVDGNPLVPVESDDFLFIAMLFNRIGEVARMKDIVIDGNREAFKVAQGKAEDHPCNQLLLEINGELPGNPWYRYIDDRKITNEDGKTKDETLEKEAEFQINRRLGELLTSIISNFTGPHIGKDRKRLISMNRRLMDFFTGKFEINKKIGVENIKALDGLGLSFEEQITSPDSKKYLLSQAVRPDMIKYPEKEDIQPRKKQLETVKKAETARVERAHQKARPLYELRLDNERKRLDAAATLNANQAKADALAGVKSSTSDITAQQAVRQRLDTIHTENVNRHDKSLSLKNEELTNIESALNGAKSKKADLNDSIKKFDADIDAIDTKIAVIGNDYSYRLFSLDIKIAGSKALKTVYDNTLGKIIPWNFVPEGSLKKSEAERKALLSEQTGRTKKQEQKRRSLVEQRITAEVDSDTKKILIHQQERLAEKATTEKIRIKNKLNAEKVHYTKLDVAHAGVENRLQQAKISASTNQADVIKAEDARLKNSKSTNASVVKNNMAQFENVHRNELKSIEKRYKTIINNLNENAAKKHQQAVNAAKRSAAEKGQRIQKPGSVDDIALSDQLKQVKEGKYRIDQVIPTESPSDFAAKKAASTGRNLVLTHDESKVWKELLTKEVFVISQIGKDATIPEEFLLSKETKESFAAHKSRVAAFSALLIGFETVNLYFMAEDLATSNNDNPGVYSVMEVIGGVLDTSDAIAACVVATYDRHLALKAVQGITVTGGVARLAVLTKVAGNIMFVANFYSAGLCYIKYQEKSLAYDDVSTAYAIQGFGFAITGVGALFALSGLTVLGAVVPVIGLVILVGGTIAYYFWFMEDMTVLEMWLEHGPFSTDSESLINYEGSRHQTRLFQVTVPQNTKRRGNYEQFHDEDAGLVKVPGELFDKTGAGTTFLLLKRQYNQDLRVPSLWLDPNSYELLAVEYATEYKQWLAEYKSGRILYKEEGGERVYYLDDTLLGKVGDVMGSGHVDAGDDKHLLAYLAPNKDKNSERFEEPFDSSQKEKVNPKEWETDGERCLDALKAGIYPGAVELVMRPREVVKYKEDNIPDTEPAYEILAMKKETYNVGNIAEITVTIPPDMPWDTWVTVMLMRVDDNSFVDDEFYIVQKIKFLFKQAESWDVTPGVSITTDVTNIKRKVTVLIDLNDAENKDYKGVKAGVYEQGNDVDFDAWISFGKSGLEKDGLASFDGNVRPYRTLDIDQEILGKLGIWDDNKAISFSPRNRVGCYSCNLVEHEIFRKQ